MKMALDWDLDETTTIKCSNARGKFLNNMIVAQLRKPYPNSAYMTKHLNSLT